MVSRYVRRRLLCAEAMTGDYSNGHQGQDSSECGHRKLYVRPQSGVNHARLYAKYPREVNHKTAQFHRQGSADIQRDSVYGMREPDALSMKKISSQR